MMAHTRLENNRLFRLIRRLSKGFARESAAATGEISLFGAYEVFVNGDSFIPNAKALEPVFKARMFAGVEL